jgi:hypothetical protein
MKTAKVSLTICAMILIAGVLFTNSEVSGQPKPAPHLYGPQNGFQVAQTAPYVEYGPMTSQPASHDPELSELLKQESKAAGEASRWMKDFTAADTEDKRAKIKTKVQEALGKQFDAQQKRRDLELTRLEAQTKKLRELMKKRTDARTTIIEKRLDQLLREADGLGWASPHGPSIPGSYSTPRFAPLDLPNPLQAK